MGEINLKNFKSELIPYENVIILAEFTLCYPGTKAAVERVFLVGNGFCEVTIEGSLWQLSASARLCHRENADMTGVSTGTLPHLLHNVVIKEKRLLCGLVILLILPSMAKWATPMTSHLSASDI
ncbi:hypothetical protein TNCV_1799761 [Trichonephila clavipes]|nr:hypothetical protein TNCV_1799761 [Trichonephila clavipes]